MVVTSKKVFALALLVLSYTHNYRRKEFTWYKSRVSFTVDRMLRETVVFFRYKLAQSMTLNSLVVNFAYLF